MTFGKNRVQYNDFLWTYYKFDEIDTYFYLNGKELAQYTARYARIQIPLIEAKLGGYLNDKIQFIIFNNLTDLKQSNIGLMTDEEYNTGGITHIIGSKVFIYFDGNHVNFEKQIRDGISQIMFDQLMFGGSVGKQIKTSTFFSLPDWYKSGIISWLGTDWSIDFDNHVRDGILSGRYEKLNDLNGSDAVYAGHSLWRFIAEEFGSATVSNIVHMTSMSSSIDKGFYYVTGMSYKMVVQEWLEYYKRDYEPHANEYQEPDGLFELKYKKDLQFNNPCISPDGKYIAYTSNEYGKYKIFLHNTETGKTKKIIKRGVSMDTKTDYSYPLLAWHPSGELLTFVIEEKGMPWFYQYNIEEKETVKRIIYNVQKVLDYDVSDNGQLIALSGVQNGQSDLFIFNISSNTFAKITDDIFSDLTPKFINNSTQIVFSSNRTNDTIGKSSGDIIGVPENFDLFVYDLATQDPLLKRITNTPLADEIMPISYGFNTISYLSDESGIYNKYLATVDSAVSSVDTTVHYRYFVNSKPVTNYSRNIISHQASIKAGTEASVIFLENKYRIYINKIRSYNSTREVKPIVTPYMQSLIKNYQQLIENEKSNDTEQTDDIDTIKIEAPLLKRFVNVYKDKDGNEIYGNNNTENLGRSGSRYVISDDGNVTIKKDEELKIPKRLNYNVEYFINDLVSQIDFNYINYSYQPFTGGGGPIYLNPGFNLFFQVGVNDLMEDYRIVGGVRLNLDLINNEYIFSYSNLKKRLDKEIVLHRNSLDQVEGYTHTRVHSHEIFYILKWPFNEALSLRGTAMYRNDMYVTLSTDQQTLETPNVYKNWGAVKTELVFDNTRILAKNLYKGNRYKIFGEYHQLLNSNGNNLIVLGFDLRNYQQINRNFIWANRIAGSTSFGSDKLIYYMGGVDNWLIPSFNYYTPIDYDQNYAYQTLATNMRGFNQNIRNGNSFVVINTELRFPVFQYFSKTPLSSGFLRNFQLVGFGDIGTAWTGSNPYSKENSLFTNYVNSGPMHISVEVQKEPIVAGFGMGARAVLFGYFIRGDVSWGIDDYRVREPVYYLSLSLDF